MKVYAIRLKKQPEKFVGKQHPTYAIESDQRLKEHGRGIQTDAYWFVKEKRAKVWTSAEGVRRFLGFCRQDETDTFSEYELVVHGPKGCEVMELTPTNLKKGD